MKNWVSTREYKRRKAAEAVPGFVGVWHVAHPKPSQPGEFHAGWEIGCPKCRTMHRRRALMEMAPADV